MLIARAYKTELDPTRKQVAMFARCCGAVRWVYNRALERRKEAYQAEKKTIRATGLNRELTAWKSEQAWLYELPNCALQEAFRDLDSAFRHFFRRVKQGGQKPGYPRFKARGRDPGHFTLRGPLVIEDKSARLPWARGQDLGTVRLKERGYLPQGRFLNHVRGIPKAEQPRAQMVNGVRVLSATISERAGRWFISLQVEQEVDDVSQPQGEPVGVDLGLHNLAVCSDGTRFDNPRALVRMERKLRRLQRQLTRRHCVKTQDNQFRGTRRHKVHPNACNIKLPGEPLSENAKKTRERIAQLHYRIACVRRDAAHQATHRIVEHKRPKTIVVEDLNVAGMMQNRRLARAIADAGMSEVKRQITYKAGWTGSEVLKADRFFPSSKTCPECGVVKSVLRLSERTYCCVECGYREDRDLTAAVNLAALAGKRSDSINACGGDGSGPAVWPGETNPAEAGTRA